MRAEPSKVLTVAQARELAIREHADQLDRDGSLHVAHVARVAALVGPSDAEQRVAWLHDVLEDTSVHHGRLRDHLPPEEWEAVCLLTHDEREPYDVYIERIAEADGEPGRLARAVKEADMLDNVRRCCEARDPAVAQYGRGLARLWTRP